MGGKISFKDMRTLMRQGNKLCRKGARKGIQTAYGKNFRKDIRAFFGRVLYPSEK